MYKAHIVFEHTCGGGGKFLSHFDPSGASGAARRKEWREEVERDNNTVPCTYKQGKLSCSTNQTSAIDYSTNRCKGLDASID